jgi:hypothetical protein
MKRKLSSPGVFLLGALLCLGGCGAAGGPGSIQRNNAGTRSVPIVAGSPAANAGAAPLEVTRADSLEQDKVEKIAEAVVEIKEKMFIAQTNDVYLNPEDYLGRTIKLEGLFKAYSEEDYGASYCFVIRYGPGCCGNDGSAGFEVAWDEGFTLEPLYPEEDAWVEAVGTLKSYEEDGFPYLYLSLSSLDVKEERGAEFVSQ